MLEVRFHDRVADCQLKFAVIASRSNGKWVFCKHKERTTYEFPGGHREKGENIFDTAKRELYEEIGALDYSIKPICFYSVIGKNRVNETGEETFGMLYYADIKTFTQDLHSEMEKVVLMDGLPDNWTYPEIQPKLLERVLAGAQSF
ncbi:NUDIX domain-containing protein [Desulfosporosinus sp. PR]|uniref:NUDIX hydrolase n=1 Tax=Candidatus Desulfosporosinus nitrosoreducens TaxID=3401928 RepID=UPI0027F45844|nr:NUDIX domain-containing protein [Desulfosporosinus sp. PR]MDQ7092588.1 NUDIX domain-containing protein [Desulfosporosinus sp. PR]